MRYAWIRRLGVVLALLGSATTIPAQHAPSGVPVFANEPQAATGPEFCPPPAHGPIIARTPFDGLENPRPNGFTEPCGDGPSVPCILYFGFGGIALQRERLGNGVVAVPDTISTFDTGLFPNAGANTLATFNDVPSDFHWGGQGTIGVQKGCHALELHGFYVPEQTDSVTITAPGRINVMFGQFTPPPGFVGNNNLWRQADQITMQLRSRLGSAELNYRHIFGPHLELIFGVRYLDQQEEFSIFTDDDNLTFSPPNPLMQATYISEVSNRIIGGTIGFEANHFIAEKMSLGFANKNTIGPNFVEVENRLVRGDGLTLALGRQTKTEVSGIVELDVFATIWFNPQCRLRAGYHMFWLLNVPQAHDQVNFNPNLPLAGINSSDSLFYHGPRIEFQFGF